MILLNLIISMMNSDTIRKWNFPRPLFKEDKLVRHATVLMIVKKKTDIILKQQRANKIEQYQANEDTFCRVRSSAL